VIKNIESHQSLEILKTLTVASYDDNQFKEKRDYWEKALAKENPAFDYVRVQGFSSSEYGGTGHLIASKDKRIPELGFIGFYETDLSDNEELIDRATEWLQENGARKIIAPFDFTILHRYRFNKNFDQIFLGEPSNPSKYEQHFKATGFTEFNHYVSAARTDFETILPFTKKETDQDSISIRELDADNFDQDLAIIHGLSLDAFKDTSDYFSKYSLDEFMYWFKDLKDQTDYRYIEILYREDNPIGFAFSFVQGKDLIMKSMGLLPKYQKLGLSKYLIHSQHKKAQEDGIARVIYALIRTGNNVTKMPYPGVDIIRNYVSLSRT